MGKVIGLLPIVPLESKDNKKKGRVYRAHRLFMTELVVSLSAWLSHFRKRRGWWEKMKDETTGNKFRRK